MAEKYTTQQVIEAIKQTEGNISATARVLKCTPSTVHRYRKKYKKIQKAIKAFPKVTGRGKEKYTVDRMIKAIEKANGILAVAARELGCTRTTVYSYIEKYPTIEAVYEDTKESNIDFVENKLMAAIDGGNITAMIFFLKTVGKDRGYVERREVVGGPGDAIKVEVVRIGGIDPEKDI